MNTGQLLNTLQSESKQMVTDVKAEWQVAQALEKGVAIDDVLVSCDSRFYREYNRDVYHTTVTDDARKLALIHYHLTRSGIYDHLPEGLFFQPAGDTSRAGNASSMASNYKANKQKEHGIRTFFTPIETEFFVQRMRVEIEETKQLEEIASGVLNDYFTDFWALPILIPQQYMIPLILLLPYTNKIAGDMNYTAQSLQEILKEKVTIHRMGPAITNVPLLGGDILGVDLICGDHFMEDYPLFECIIGPLTHTLVPDYLHSGALFILLQTFYRFFFPVGADVVTTIKVPEHLQQFKLESDDVTILNYTTVL